MTDASNSAHILLVDDDPKIRLLLRRCFEPEGYKVSEAADQAEVLAQLSNSDFDLVTLDLNLGRDNGLAVAQEIRNRGNTPIIMVTGKGDPIDRVVGLELGADDYITKPFHLREVLARVRSVLRRSVMQSAEQREPQPQDQQSSVRYHFGNWNIDFRKFELVDDTGKSCDLTTTEFQILEVFVRRPNCVFTRDQLMDLLKGQDWNPNDRAIDNQISRLRKKIEPDPKSPKYLKTVRGLGYSFVADVTKV